MLISSVLFLAFKFQIKCERNKYVQVSYVPNVSFSHLKIKMKMKFFLFAFCSRGISRSFHWILERKLNACNVCARAHSLMCERVRQFYLQRKQRKQADRWNVAPRTWKHTWKKIQNYSFNSEKYVVHIIKRMTRK